MLEGELQAREIVIAVSKSEQIKKLLNPLKWPSTISGFRATSNINTISPNTVELNPDQTIKYSADPISALSRDSLAVYEPSFDYSTTLALYNLKMFHLENLINNQNYLRNKMNDHLKEIETKYETLLKELEDERVKNNNKTEQQLDEPDRVKLENEIKSLSQSLEETKTREKQIILNLITERKHLIIKLIEEKHQNEELKQNLSAEKRKVAEMVEGLEDESKRSLQMEAELEKFLNDFEKERISLNTQLQLSESKNSELLSENERLRNTIDNLQKQLALLGKGTDVDSGKWNIGEGVRSSIVTMPINAKTHSMSSVTPVAHPKASVAQPVTKSIPNNLLKSNHENVTNTESKLNIILPPPSIPVPVPQSKQMTGTIKKAPVTQAAISDSFSVTNSNPNDDSINTNDSSNSTKAAEVKSDSSVKQTVKFYENSVNQTKQTTTNSNSNANTTTNTTNNLQATSTMKKASGARIPPPIPPNKPSIKPVLPSQAILQSKMKDNKSNLITKSQFNVHIQSNNSSSSNTKG